MVALSQFDRLVDYPERLVGLLGILLLACYGVWALLRWFQAAPKSPDPWDATVDESVQADDAVPLCHRCLTPHDPQVDFCHECGAPVGTYTNWLPFPYLFSIGHTLRIGTEGKFRHSPLTIAGFICLSIAEYSVFAPLYWVMFLRRLFHHAPSDLPPSPLGSAPQEQ